MRTIAMIATTAVITALTVWSIYAVSSTTPAIATASTPSLNIICRSKATTRVDAPFSLRKIVATRARSGPP
jgi:hypothetical protein